MADRSRGLTREELYDLIWSRPATKLANELGITYYTLMKVCSELAVPKPPAGYWQHVSSGRSPERLPLPELGVGIPREAFIEPQESTLPPWIENAEVVSKIAGEREPRNRIRVVHTLRDPHPLIRETKARLERAEPDTFGILRARLNSPSLDVRVSKSSLHRALRIMDALVKALEARGYRIEVARNGYVHTWVRVGAERVKVALVEKTERGDRPLTKEEERKPPSEIYHRWMYTPTGRLTFLIDEYGADLPKKKWGDKRGTRLEDKLNDIVIGLTIAGEARRLLTLRHQEEERQRREAEMRRLEEARRREAEEVRCRALYEEATSWVKSQNLRAFLKACEHALTNGRGEIAPGSPEAEWLRWAYHYADRLDPLENDYLDRIIPKRKTTGAT